MKLKGLLGVTEIAWLEPRHRRRRRRRLVLESNIASILLANRFASAIISKAIHKQPLFTSEATTIRH